MGDTSVCAMFSIRFYRITIDLRCLMLVVSLITTTFLPASVGVVIGGEYGSTETLGTVEARNLARLRSQKLGVNTSSDKSDSETQIVPATQTVYRIVDHWPSRGDVMGYLMGVVLSIGIAGLIAVVLFIMTEMTKLYVDHRRCRQEIQLQEAEERMEYARKAVIKEHRLLVEAKSRIEERTVARTPCR